MLDILTGAMVLLELCHVGVGAPRSSRSSCYAGAATRCLTTAETRPAPVGYGTDIRRPPENGLPQPIRWGRGRGGVEVEHMHARISHAAMCSIYRCVLKFRFFS